MEINATAINEISDGNAVCKLCISYLTLGKNDEVKRDNLHIHFNGRKHRFHALIFDKSFRRIDYEDDSQPVPEAELCFNKGDFNILFLYENGICNDNCTLNFYCNFCDCELPQLTKDKRLNMFNINVHLLGKRHNFNILSDLAKHINVENENNKLNEIFTTNNVEPINRTPHLYSSITTAIYLDNFFSVEKIFCEIPDELQDHKKTIHYDDSNCKFTCNLCNNCFVTVSKNRITIVSNVLCHIKGRKHLCLYKKDGISDIKIISFDEVEDNNLKKFIKLSNDKIIDKNEKYICRNSCDNIVCKLCKCFLPNIGTGRYLVAIKNLQLHFMGKKHRMLIKNEAHQEMTKIIKNESKRAGGKCDATILKIFNEFPNNLPKDNVNYFMISKSLNLVCNICSCVVHRDVGLSLSNKQILTLIETHIQTRKHLRNYSCKEGVKNYNDVISNTKKSLHMENKNKNTTACDSLESVMKLDSCGQFVCSLCQKIIVPRNCELESAVASHLKGKRHKQNNNKDLKQLTENILNDIIDSLPSNYKINKKCLFFIFSYGIVNCTICNYMFRVNNNYGLRNNLMIHITSTKHNKLLNDFMKITCPDDYIKTKDNHLLALDRNKFTSKLIDLGDEKFVGHIFENYIPKNLHFNKKHLSFKLSKLYCNACNQLLTIPSKLYAAVHALINHCTKDLHKKNVENSKSEFNGQSLVYKKSKKITEKTLNHIFDSKIPKNIAHNKQHIKLISNKVFCDICRCILLDAEKPNEVIVKELKLHFESANHSNNYSKLKPVGKKISDDKLVHSEAYGNEIHGGMIEEKHLFINFLESDLQFNERYISYDNFEKSMFCDLCGCNVPSARHVQDNVSNLREHLKGSQHTYNLQNVKVYNKMSQIANNTNPVAPKDTTGHLEGFTRESSVMKVNVKSDEKSKFISKGSTDACHDKVFLNDLFTNHIQGDLKFNEQYIAIENKRFVCRICNCQVVFSKDPIAAACNLTDHLRFKSHKQKLMLSGIKKKTNYNNTLIEKDQQFLDGVFTNYIEHGFQCNRQYIILKANIITCSICKCRMPKAEDPKITAKTLLNHLKGTFHEKQVKRLQTVDNDSVIKNPSCTKNADNTDHVKGSCPQTSLKKSESTHKVVSAKRSDSSDDGINSLKNHEKIVYSNIDLINDLFIKFIPEDFHFNKQYVTSRSNKIICKLCNCQMACVNPQATATNLLSHLKGNSHKGNLKKSENAPSKVCKASNFTSRPINISTEKNETYVDELFKNLINYDLHINRKYINIESNRLACSICKCTLLKSLNPEVTAKNVIEHIKGRFHKSNMKKSPVSDGMLENNVSSSDNDHCDSSTNNPAFLDDLFTNFIQQDFQFNRQYISIKLNKLACCVCDCILFKPVIPLVTAMILMEHLKGSVHKNNLMTKDKSEFDNTPEKSNDSTFKQQ